jgi:hypothetical protein
MPMIRPPRRWRCPSLSDSGYWYGVEQSNVIAVEQYRTPFICRIVRDLHCRFPTTTCWWCSQ